ncbi:hypothetical protein ACMFMF_000187 [Clarireedia jacksonii]
MLRSTIDPMYGPARREKRGGLGGMWNVESAILQSIKIPYQIFTSSLDATKLLRSRRLSQVPSSISLHPSPAPVRIFLAPTTLFTSSKVCGHPDRLSIQADSPSPNRIA